MEYLRILRLAATTLEASVEEELRRQLEAGRQPDREAIRAALEPVRLACPEVAPLQPELSGYDELLAGYEERGERERESAGGAAAGVPPADVLGALSGSGRQGAGRAVGAGALLGGTGIWSRIRARLNRHSTHRFR